MQQCYHLAAGKNKDSYVKNDDDKIWWAVRLLILTHACSFGCLSWVLIQMVKSTWLFWLWTKKFSRPLLHIYMYVYWSCVVTQLGVCACIELTHIWHILSNICVIEHPEFVRPLHQPTNFTMHHIENCFHSAAGTCIGCFALYILLPKFFYILLM